MRLPIQVMVIVFALLTLPAVAPAEDPPEFVLTWGSAGSGDGQFHFPFFLSCNSAGDVYVVDLDNHRIQKFSSSGAFLTKWGSQGTADGYFINPRGVASDGDDNVYVADQSNHRIQKFDGNGAFLAKWGSYGTGDGQFRDPFDVACDAAGNVYVADVTNQRIQKFDSNGNFLIKWGTQGSGDGQFFNPISVTTDEAGYVYVADSWNHRIQKFDSNGNFLTKWGSQGSGDGQFGDPHQVHCDADGDVYVADPNNNRVQKFDGEGNFLTKWGSSGAGDGQFTSPGGVAIGPAGGIYVADTGNHRIQKFGYPAIPSEPPPEFILEWGSQGSGNEQFLDPRMASCDAAGNVYVPDFGNHRVQKFDGAGTFVTMWGEFGFGDGQLNRPTAVACNGTGEVYVADSYNHRIQKFDESGTFLMRWGMSGTGDGEFRYPNGVACDADGNVYVSGRSNHRLQKFDGNGNFLTKWGTYGSSDGQFSYPYGVACDLVGSVFVADQVNQRVQKFDGNGNFLLKWGTAGSGDGEFQYPYGVACDPDGKVYAVDTDNHRIQKFDGSGSFLVSWGSVGSGEGQFYYPYGVACDPLGSVYVMDNSNYRVQKFGDPPPPNTPTGDDVTVTPTDPGSGSSPVTLTFDNVTEPGETTLSLESSGPGAPSGFRIGNPPTYYSIETTASYTGSIEICIDYSTISFNHESKLKLFHYVDGAWVDATVSLDPDADIICASVTSLSTFAAFTAADFVEAVPDGDCLSIANTCETVPVIFDRTDVTEARGISVTFTLSPELELCVDPATSIDQGTWLDGFPGQTAFQVVSNGSGSYTVDQAILGESPVPCGEASGGELFTLDLQAAGGDGTGTITVTDVIVRDCLNAPIPGIPGSPASITIDTAAPTAVADLTAAQVKTGNDTDGTTKITLTFGAPGDADVVEVYRAPYHLGGVNAHPEYDDVIGAGPPATPSYPPALPWILTGVNTTGQTDETTERGYWYYVMFTKDACGNISAVSNLAGGTLNYHLGDVVPDPGATRGNNDVDGLDISRLGDNYGVSLTIPPDTRDYLDVGPTADFSVDALPTTDNEIQFEDLMMFAINFGQVSAPQAPPEEDILEPPFVTLEITEQGDLIEARLALHANDALVKGIHTRIAAAGLELLGAIEGSLVSSQADPVFFKDLQTPEGVSVDLAVLGTTKTIVGEGELAVLTFRVLEPGATPELVDTELRGRANRRLGSGTQSVDAPTVAVTELSLLGAYPNPFTNSTDIVFRIPDRRFVTVAIYDVTGRLVARLGGRPLEAGEHRLAWDGRDSAGSRVGTGIYFYSFDAGSLRETRKLVLTR